MLITGVLLASKGGSGYFSRFYARRALRIWPLYYLAMVFVFLIAPHLGDVFNLQRMQGREWYWLFYLTNIDDVLHGEPAATLRVVWSLGVEEQFYLVWPIVVLLCTPRQLIGVCLAAVLAAPALRVGLTLAGHEFPAVYMLTPARMDAFAIGGLVAVLGRQPGGLASLAEWPKRVFPVGVAILVGIAIRQTSFNSSGRLMETLGYSVAALTFGSAVVLALTSERVAIALNWPVLRHMGKYSYAIYLIHAPLWEFVGPRLPSPTLWGSGLPAQLLAYLVMLPLLMTLGWLSWTLLEQHILSLKRFLEYERVVIPLSTAGLGPIGVPPLRPGQANSL